MRTSNSLSNKILVGLVIAGLLLPAPMTVIAQNPPIVQVTDLPPSLDLDTDAMLDTRSAKDEQAAKADAERLKRLQEEDKKKCEAAMKAGGLGNMLQNTLGSAISKITEEAFKELLPEELGKLLQGQGFTDRINSEIQSELNNQLGTTVRSRLETRLPAVLSEASQNGQVTLSDEQRKQLIAREIQLAVQQSFPSVVQSSIQTGTGNAIRSTIEEGMPTVVGNISSQLPQRFSTGMESQFQSLLGTDIFSLLSDRISTDNPDAARGISGNVLEEVTNMMIKELAKRSTAQLSNPDNLNQLTTILTQQITTSGALDTALTDASFSSVNTLFGGEFDTVVNQMLIQSGDGLNNEIGNIISGITNTTSGSFNSIINSTVSGLTDTLTSTLTTGVGGIMESITTPLTDALGGAVSSLTEPLTGALGDVVGSLTEPLTGAVNGALGGVVNSITGSITNGLGGALTSSITNAFGPALGGVLSGPINSVLGGITGSALGGLLGPLGSFVGGVYVPTQEQAGGLLSAANSTQSNTKTTANNTGQIDKTTKKIEELTVEACTKLKSIQRIQAAYEQSRTVEDPKLRAEAATKAEQWRQSTLDYVKTGRDSDGDGSPDTAFFVTNLDDSKTSVRSEARNIFKDDLERSKDSFKEQTLARLNKDEQRSYQSSISQEEYRQFSQGKITNNDEWWRIMFAITNPFEPNTPESSYNISRNLVAQRQAQAEEDLTNQLIASQGYLPIQECVEKTSDGKACRRWETVAPAIEVKETVSNIMRDRQQRYLNPDPGDVAPGNEPMLEELRTFTPSTAGGGSRGPGAFDIGSILDLITGLIGRREDTQGKGSLSFKFELPPLGTVQANPNTNIGKLTWEGRNLRSCQVTNDWFQRGNQSLSIIRPIGTTLAGSGSLNINLPLSFDVRFIRTRAGQENSIPVTTTTPGLVYDQKTFTIPDDIQSGDNLRISFHPHTPPYSVSIAVGSSSKPEIISKLQEALNNAVTSNENPTQKSEFSRYNFTYQGNTQSIVITPKLTYALECTDNTGERLPKSVTIRR